MRYSSADAFRTALEYRLKQAAAEPGGASLVRQRKMVVFDRLLVRLLVVAPDRWLVKGGVALDLRLRGRGRTTKDLDLARQDHEDVTAEDLLAASEYDACDFFAFHIERSHFPHVPEDHAALRYRVRSELAGRTFDDVTLDISFQDPLPATPDIIQGVSILEFAGLRPIQLPAAPLEQHLAEKLHAYTRRYHGGLVSTRTKDLVDILLIRTIGSFRAGSLRYQIESTFEGRETHVCPVSLPTPPEAWAIPYRVLAVETGLDPVLATAFLLARGFLDPVLSGDVTDDTMWDPIRGAWKQPKGV